MDRKHCVLLYSKHSQASINLLTYIKGLPLDFPKITGMTMICVDHEQFRDTLQKNGIEYVPVLLVEYYKGSTPNLTKQKLESDYIYMWIDQVMKSLRGDEWPQTPQALEGGRRRTELPANINQSGGVTDQDVQEDVQEDVEEDVPNIQKNEKLDITALATQMAKDRESYISDTAPAQGARPATRQ